MNWRKLTSFFIVSFLLTVECFAQSVVLIGSPGLPKIDVVTAQRLYMGRSIEIGDTPVEVVNAAVNTALRNQFLNDYLDQNEERYTAYWRVRQFIGKGRPPREVSTANEIIHYVQTQKDCVGYIFTTDVTNDVNVILEK